MVVDDSVDAFDHFNCRRAHINQHSVVNMPNKNTPSNRKHEVEYGTMKNDLTSVSCIFCFIACAISYVHLYGTIGHTVPISQSHFHVSFHVVSQLACHISCHLLTPCRVSTMMYGFRHSMGSGFHRPLWRYTHCTYVQYVTITDLIIHYSIHFFMTEK